MESEDGALKDGMPGKDVSSEDGVLVSRFGDGSCPDASSEDGGTDISIFPSCVLSGRGYCCEKTGITLKNR